MRHLALTITTTLATLAVILVVWELRSIVVLFLFAILVAATVRRPIDYLIQKRLRPWLAMLLIYSSVFIGLSGLAALLSLPITRELGMLTEELAHLYERGYGLAQDRLHSNGEFFRRLPPTEAVGQFLLETQPTALARRILGLTQTFAFFIGQAVLVIVVSIYWTADQLYFERLWLSLLAPGRRTWMRERWYAIEETVGAYIRSEVLQSVLAGGLLTLGFWFMEVKYPFLLAAIGAIAWFIPLVGALFAVPLIGLVALLSGIGWAVAAAIYAVVIFALMEFVVEPCLYDRSKHGVILVIVVMMAMVEALGLPGLLLAPPLALTLQIMLDELLAAPVTSTAAPVITLGDLEEQFTQVRTIVSTAETQSPSVSNLVDRLEQLLQKTQETAV
ncbi:MAG: AI-2E family transporter [Caldilineaceae bacterium]